jgi:sterol desaturase/sphingolipid hydroxylase (fatty acid hydroxylase superfamily)
VSYGHTYEVPPAEGGKVNPLHVYGILLLPWILAAWNRGFPFGRACLLFLAGLFLWTFAEYAVHRWVIHREWRPGRLAKAIKAVQHESPEQPKYLKLKGTIPTYIGMLGMLYLVMGDAVAAGLLLCGFSVGYIINELVHQVCHGLWPRHPVLRYLKRNHLIHHFTEASCGFSLILPLWDNLLGTRTKGSLPEFLEERKSTNSHKVVQMRNP